MNLTVLGFFKYFYFVLGTTQSIATLFGGHFEMDLPFKIILPLGISFYTFQSLSYVFDMYRGLVPPIKKYTQFITYVMFWTQLVAGPILRAHEIVPQLENYRRPTKGEGLLRPRRDPSGVLQNRPCRHDRPHRRCWVLHVPVKQFGDA